jgi:hypothetical protein
VGGGAVHARIIPDWGVRISKWRREY